RDAGHTQNPETCCLIFGLYDKHVGFYFRIVSHSLGTARRLKIFVSEFTPVIYQRLNCSDLAFSFNSISSYCPPIVCAFTDGSCSRSSDIIAVVNKVSSSSGGQCVFL